MKTQNIKPNNCIPFQNKQTLVQDSLKNSGQMLLPSNSDAVEFSMKNEHLKPKKFIDKVKDFFTFSKHQEPEQAIFTHEMENAYMTREDDITAFEAILDLMAKKKQIS